MAEALYLSQMAATRGRAGQTKAESLEYRMMQDSLGSGQLRDREERGLSLVLRGYRPVVMQPGKGLGRMAQGHAIGPRTRPGQTAIQRQRAPLLAARHQRIQCEPRGRSGSSRHRSG